MSQFLLFAIFHFNFFFENWLFFCLINFTSWYLASLYKFSSICNFVYLNCLRRFFLSFIDLANSSSNQSWLLLLILRFVKGAILSTTFKSFSQDLSNINIGDDIIFRKINLFYSFIKNSFIKYFFKDRTRIWLCIFAWVLKIFRAHYINWWSESPTSITLFYDIFQTILVRIWSSREEVVLIIRVGSLVIAFKENFLHKSLYLGIKEIDIKISKKINFSFFKSISFKLFTKVSRKVFTFGGL